MPLARMSLKGILCNWLIRITRSVIGITVHKTLSYRNNIIHNLYRLFIVFSMSFSIYILINFVHNYMKDTPESLILM